MFCWLFKFIISRAEDGDRDVSGPVKRHIEHCADCRAFYDACLSMRKDLASEAASMRQQVSVGPAERVLTALPEQQVQIYKTPTRFWPIAAAACVAVAVVLGVWFFHGPQRGGNGKPDPVPTGGLDELISAQQRVTKDVSLRLSAIVEAPIAGELENLTSDTESAVRFLVKCVGVDASGTRRITLN